MVTPIMVDGKELVRKVIDLAMRHPNRVEECEYVHEGRPCCIVGQAMALSGISVDELRTFGGCQLERLVEDGLVEGIDEDCTKFLNKVQAWQDDGKAWLDALPFGIFDEEIADGFRRLCYQHDLTYMMSDDTTVWRRGSQSHTRIRVVRDVIKGYVDCDAIWNEVAAKKTPYPDMFKL